MPENRCTHPSIGPLESPIPLPAPPSERVDFQPINFAPVDIACEATLDGGFVLSSRTPLGTHDPSLSRMFRAAVEAAPDRLFLAERCGADWRTLTYAQCRPIVDALATALLDRGLSAMHPLVMLSENSIDHALLMLAAYTAGVPLAPISPAYSLQSRDHAKLKQIAALLDPGLVYVTDTEPYSAALRALNLGAGKIAASRNGAGFEGITSFAELAKARPDAAVEKTVASCGANTIAKFLFTSGSTGLPKAVINTHGMLATGQQQLLQVWPFLGDVPPVLVDWLPWSHTFGGNHNFNLVMRHAGTLYIDAGKPLPTSIGETVRNLREISPTIYFNVPAGYSVLVPHLERDDALTRTFFAHLRLVFYAGAALPQDLWERLDAAAIRATGKRVPLSSGWGTTETAPSGTYCHFLTNRSGIIGVPVPGVEVKLVPQNGKLEARLRGPNVTAGYWKRPDLTAAAFDEEGYYRPGDAVKFANPTDPKEGLMFDGRLAEDFKLATGTWVHTGALRVGVLAATSPALADAVIAGENRECIGILAWPNVAGCEPLTGVDGPNLSLADMARHPTVRDYVRTAIARWNAAHPGSSQQVARALLLAKPPNSDAGEITDKGYINQRAVIASRKQEVERLFGVQDPEVIELTIGDQISI